MKLSENQIKVIKESVRKISDILGQTGSVNVYDDKIVAFNYPHPNGVSISIQLSRPYLNAQEKEKKECSD